MNQQPAIYRYRIHFALANTLAYVSVLELGRLWERTLRRAQVPLRYSQGFNPRPKFQFPAPLPVGCGGEAEFLDVLFDAPREPQAITSALRAVAPADMRILRVEPRPLRDPAPAEQLIAAEYRILLREIAPQDVQTAVDTFNQTEHVWMEKRGRRRGQQYDLRPLVLELQLGDSPPPWIALEMRLAARPGATGRPDVVLQSLGLSDVPRRCTRTRLILST